MTYWRATDKGDPIARALADKHYTRQTVGASSFTRPGYNFTLVLSTNEGTACFVWWRPKWEAGICRMDGLEAIECTIFRNETSIKSSVLIMEAVSMLGTRTAQYDLHGICTPKDGLITGVSSSKTKEGRSKWSEPGKCFRKAGWKPFEHAKGTADVWLRYAGPMPVREPVEHQTCLWTKGGDT